MTRVRWAGASRTHTLTAELTMFSGGQMHYGYTLCGRVLPLSAHKTNKPVSCRACLSLMKGSHADHQ